MKNQNGLCLVVSSELNLPNRITRANKCGTECAHGEVNAATFHDFGFDVREASTLESFVNRRWQLNGFHPASPRNLPVGEVEERAIGKRDRLVENIDNIPVCQGARHSRVSHVTTVKRRPQASTGRENAMDFAQCPRNMHVRQRHATNDEVETSIGERKLFRLASYGRHATFGRSHIGSEAFVGDLPVVRKNAVISAAKIEAILRVERHSRNFGLNRSEQLHKAEYAPASWRAIYIPFRLLPSTLGFSRRDVRTIVG